MKNKKYFQFTSASLSTLILLGCFASPEILTQNGKLKTAQSIFENHCKKSGENIYKVVKDVEGIYLLKLRGETVNYGNQFLLDDPYGKDLVGSEGYITSFLRGSYQTNVKLAKNYSGPGRIGYFYVDAIDQKDKNLYRYTSRIYEPWLNDKSYLQGYIKFELSKALIKNSSAKYGITFDDISSPKDREYWIAGSSLKVIDLETKEIIAERIGYMIDLKQGDKSNGRSPWLLAADHACPAFKTFSRSDTQPGFTRQARQAQDFVEKVLIPKQDRMQ